MSESPSARATGTAATTTAFGRVSELWRFPVKSMQGERLGSVEIGPLGIDGDRRFALRDLTSGKIVSAKLPRLGAALLDCNAALDDSGAAVTVRIGADTYHSDRDVDALDSALSELLGRPVGLVRAGDGEEMYTSEWPELDDMALSGVTVDLPLHHGTFADLAPLHLLTTSSIATIAATIPNSDVTVARFRPGIVIEHESTEGFVENGLEGRRARIGTAEIVFGQVTPRCIMTTLAQPGLDRDRAILQTVAGQNRRDFGGFGNFACLGVYADVVEDGTVSVGQTIEFID